ncbi:GGDEF domain-containing protein [Inmirania thermothiophila]|uniref:diguanylate cyclase n=1 Tax=Inmirania thermothiophila TaxID=1750597 RepID=A0A3N1XTQ3_9GAMM|nr:GGDEF domain-containing protein [Inmirania thermothiophila]ROR29638.1 diguanylate cyclase (GGDEF)-like protein [Inmirania thermothiophila]
MTEDEAGALEAARPELARRLELCRDLPSPPGVALRLVRLGEDPEADLDEIVGILRHDPALAAKVLRVANSPLYSRQRNIDNLRQAILLLGLNGTLTLALSFSLVPTLRDGGRDGLDHARFWRRTCLGSLAAQVLADRAGLPGLEDAFLAGLLQDIGILALERVEPGLYAGLGPDAGHDAIAARERERLGTDHAAVGAWLLARWALPARLRRAVARSHRLAPPQEAEDLQGLLDWAVAGAAVVAGAWIDGDGPEQGSEAVRAVAAAIGWDGAACGEALERIAAHVPETEALLECELASPEELALLQERARELATARSLHAVQQAQQIRRHAQALETRARELEERARRDSLTGLYNRAWLDQMLEEEFRRAESYGWPLSVAFIDLDRFKTINDTYGHAAGDTVLRRIAALLLDNSRETDIVARYGGEEFVLLLPGSGRRGAQAFCERLLAACRAAATEVAPGRHVAVTASIGLATHGEHQRYESPDELVRAADKALYAAKVAGRDRLVVVDERR